MKNTTFTWKFGKMRRPFAGLLILFLLILVMVMPASCSFGDSSNNPIKWSFVSGDGSWNANSRSWDVTLAPNETKSSIIRLDNTGSQNIWVLLVLGGAPDFIMFHLDGPFVPPSGNVLEVPVAGNIEFKVNAFADSLSTPPGSHTYAINFRSSTNEKQSPVPPIR